MSGAGRVGGGLMFARIGGGFAAAVLTVAAFAGPVAAQKYGGTLIIQHWDSPANMSIHETTTYSVIVPMMAVFNNLVLFRQDEEQNSMDNIVRDLAESWSWSEDGKELTFKLRQGVKWHDGKPFTAADVRCTLDSLQDRAKERFRINPRKEWYNNVDEVVTNGDHEVVFRLKRPQPALLLLLASGDSPIYPCHVSPTQMRQHPIGTGPFKFVEFKQNESIKVVKNPDYWKKGRPYLDAIEYKIVPNRSTAILGFVAGQYDLTWPYNLTPALMRDVKSQAPNAICELRTNNGTANLLVNREKPPFDNPELRKALALTIDRKAFIDIMSEGQYKTGAAMLPPPEGRWGMPE